MRRVAFAPLLSSFASRSVGIAAPRDKAADQLTDVAVVNVIGIGLP